MPQLNDPQLAAWATAHALRLHLWRLTESEEELSALFPTHFNYTDEARRRFTSPKRRREWLAARVLLHYVAGVSERLQYLSNGCPALPESGLHVSISHTSDVVALLLSPTPCGIDVEQRAPRALRLRSHFLDAAEEAAFFQGTQASRLCLPPQGIFRQLPPQGTQASRLCPPPHTTFQNLSPEDTATLLWSAKEAVFKCFSARGIDYVTQIHLRPACEKIGERSDEKTGERSDKKSPVAPALLATFDTDTSCATVEARVAFAILPDFVLTVSSSPSALFLSKMQNNR